MKKSNPLLDKLRSRMDSESTASGTAVAEPLPIASPRPVKTEVGGKAIPVAFSITDEDQGVVKSLRAWLLSQDIEATGSQIVRACISAAKRDQSFVDLVQGIRATDGRRKK